MTTENFRQLPNGQFMNLVDGTGPYIRTAPGVFELASLAPSWALMVARNRIPGALRTVRLGNNPDVDSGTVPETVWSGGGQYPWMSAATALEAVSTSVQDNPTGTGAATINVPGLDANFSPLTVPVTLNGTTPVALSSNLLRVQAAAVSSRGSAAVNGGTNIGDIIIRDAGGGTVRMIIPAGYGVSRSSTYTVPADRVLTLESFFGCVNRSTNTDTVEIGIVLRNAITGMESRPFEFSIRATPYLHDLKDAPSVVPARTDVRFDVVFTANPNTNVSAAFAGKELLNT